MSQELGPSIQTTSSSSFFSEPVPDKKTEVTLSSSDDSDYQLIQKEFDAIEPLKKTSETKESKTEVENTPYRKARRLIDAIKKRETKSIIELTQDADVRQWINLRDAEGAHAGHYTLNPPNVALFKRLLSIGLDAQPPSIIHGIQSIKLRNVRDPRPSVENIYIWQESVITQILKNSAGTQSKLIAVINQHYDLSFSTTFLSIQTWEAQFAERNNKLKQLNTSSEIFARKHEILKEKSQVYDAVVIHKDYKKAEQLIKKNPDFLFEKANSDYYTFSGEENYPDLFSQLFQQFKTTQNASTQQQIKILIQTIIEYVPAEKLNQLVLGRAFIHHLLVIPALEDLLIQLCKKPGINLNLQSAIEHRYIPPDSTISHYQSPLYYLLHNKRYHIARELIDLGANLHECSTYDLSTLWGVDYDNKHSKLEAAVLLLDAYGNRPGIDPWVSSHGFGFTTPLNIFSAQQAIMLHIDLEKTPSTTVTKLIQHFADPYLMYPNLDSNPSLNAQTSSRVIEIFIRCLIVRDISLINQPLHNGKTIYHWLVLHSKKFEWEKTATETLVLLLLANKANYQDFYKCAQEENNQFVLELLQKHKPFIKLPFTIASNPIHFETDFSENDNINPFIVDAKTVKPVFSSQNKKFSQIKAPKILNRSNAVDAFREGFKLFMNDEFLNALPYFLKAASLDRHPCNFLYLGIVLAELHSKPDTQHPLYALFADQDLCQQQASAFFKKITEQYKDFLKASENSALSQFHLGMFYKYVRKIDLAAEETLAEAGKQGFAFAYYYIANHPIDYTPVMHYLKSAANLGSVAAAAQLEILANSNTDAAVSITTTQNHEVTPRVFIETKSDEKKSEISSLNETDKWFIFHKAFTLFERGQYIKAMPALINALPNPKAVLLLERIHQKGFQTKTQDGRTISYTDFFYTDPTLADFYSSLIKNNEAFFKHRATDLEGKYFYGLFIKYIKKEKNYFGLFDISPKESLATYEKSLDIYQPPTVSEGTAIAFYHAAVRHKIKNKSEYQFDDVRNLTLAAKNGYLPAQVDLFYYYKDLFYQNVIDAGYWLEQALAQNPPIKESLLKFVNFIKAQSFFYACRDNCNLQIYDEVGELIAKDDMQKKIAWHEVAANSGDIESQYFLGYHFLHQRNFPLAKEHLTKAQKCGHASAKLILDIGLHNYFVVERYPQFDFFQRKPKAEMKEEGMLLELGL